MNEITIVTDEQYCFTSDVGDTYHVYYGTYRDYHGKVSICRLSSLSELAPGQVVRSRIYWSKKAKICVAYSDN